MNNRRPNPSSEFIYGIHSSIALLKSRPNIIKKLLIKKNFRNEQLKKVFKKAKENNITIIELNKDSLTSVCLSSKHQGVACEINPNMRINFNLDIYLQITKDPFIVIFDSIQDPRNLGSCIRSANAFGVSLIIKKKSKSCSITPAVHKASSGGLQGLSLFETNNLLNVVKMLKKHNIVIIGTDHKATEPFYNIKNNNLSCGAAVIIGSEGDGISKSLLRCCEKIYKIPIFGTVECLNVSVATGIVLYELSKFFKKE